MLQSAVARVARLMVFHESAELCPWHPRQQLIPHHRPSDPPHDGEEGRCRAGPEEGEEVGREEVMCAI
jgi:hypothetical protein